MQISQSAHVDTFTRDNLPPRAGWPELLFPLPELKYPASMNCSAELLDRHVNAGAGSRRCIVTDAGTWTYADLLARSNEVARVLVEDLGLVPGNRVLLRGPNNPWLVASWFGVLKAGGVAVTTMPLLRAGELGMVAEIAQVKIAVCDHRFLADLDAARIPGLSTIPYGGPGPGDLTQLTVRKSADFKNVETASNDVCLLAFTSGTTGKPKATMHFHRDVLAVADTFSRHVLRPTLADLFAGTSPLAFTFGLGQSVIFPLRGRGDLPHGTAPRLQRCSRPSSASDNGAGDGAHRLSRDGPEPEGSGSLVASCMRICGETPPKATGTQSMRRAGFASSTASGRPRCSTSSSRRQVTRSGPGAPAER
jgi:2-aminobenzoate-CoA ligase